MHAELSKNKEAMQSMMANLNNEDETDQEDPYNLDDSDY